VKKRANGDAKPFKNARSGRWELFIDLPRELDGKRRRKKVSADSERDCRDAARIVRTDLARGRPIVDERQTVADFLTWWQREVLPGSVSESTLTTYGNAIRLWIVPAIGSVHLAKLGPADVTRMMSKMKAAGLSPNTISLARRVLRRALRRAEQEGYVIRNVAALVDGPKINQAAAEVLDLADGRKLLAAVRGHRMEAAIVVIMATGLRRGELLGLTWDCIDIDAAPYAIRVRRQLLRQGGNGLGLFELKTPKSRRTVHIPQQVAEVLRSHRARQARERLAFGPGWGMRVRPRLGLNGEPVDDMAAPVEVGTLVFTSPIGTPVDPRNFNTLFGELTTKAGLGHRHPHEARHGAASVLYALGVPLKTISDVLGHSTTTITADLYTHVFEEGRREAADAMGIALFGIPG
jgi:integrase